jgi:hypothetical protein
MTLVAKPPAVQSKKTENNRQGCGPFLLRDYFIAFTNGTLRQYRRRFRLPEIAV